MEALFSYKLWLIIAGRMLNALMPAYIALLVFFLWKGRGRIAGDAPFRLFAAFILADFALRLMLFFSGTPYEGRYFHPLVIAFSVFAGAGLIVFASFLSRFQGRFRFLTERNCLVGLAAALILANGGKALNPPDRKCWLSEIPEEIKKRIPKGAKAVLITDNNDIRTAYYAGASHFKLARPDMTDFAAGAIAEEVGGKTAVDSSGTRFGNPLLFEGDKEAELVLSLAKPYPFRNGVMALEWKESFKGAVRLYYMDGATKKWEPLGSYQDTAELRFRNKKGPVGSDRFKIMIRPSDGNSCALRGIRIVLDTRWRILARGRGAANAGRWFPVLPPDRIDNFADSVRALGGNGVFVLVMQKDADFQKLFSDKGLPFPLDLVGEFKDRKKGPFTLYQGRIR